MTPFSTPFFNNPPNSSSTSSTTHPPNAANYRFDSVAVKEPKFEIDGVFLPPEDPGIVYFCEVQFQKDDLLYERLFSETFLYFYRNRSRFTDWQAVVIYPSRQKEQADTRPYRYLLNSPQVQRIYFDELGDIDQLPLGTALMVLTTLPESEAPEKARSLLARAPQETPTSARQQAIIEMVATIMVYKFTNLSRSEVDAMLGLNLQETRVYQEAKNEGRQEGRQEGEQIGETRGQRSLLTLLLSQKFAPIPQPMIEAIALLSSERLENLAIALLSFNQLSEAEAWMKRTMGDQLTEILRAKAGELPAETPEILQNQSLEALISITQAAAESPADAMRSADAVATWLKAQTTS